MRIFEIDQPQQKELSPDLIDYIKTNCSEALAMYNGGFDFLKRGFGDKSNDYYIVDPPKYRKPTDSWEFVQTLFDQCLKKLGHTALRSNSIFATSKTYHAEKYGNVFYIIPENGFSYTFTNQHDMVLRFVQTKYMIDHEKILSEMIDVDESIIDNFPKDSPFVSLLRRYQSIVFQYKKHSAKMVIFTKPFR